MAVVETESNNVGISSRDSSISIGRKQWIEMNCYKDHRIHDQYGCCSRCACKSFRCE